MTKAKKIIIGILILFILFALAAVIIIPRLIDVDRYRPDVIARIRAETGKTAEIGRLTLSFFPTVAIRVDDFALANPEGYPHGYIIKARRIDAVVNAQALWNRQIVITSLELDEPEISFLQTPRGEWNFETHDRPQSARKVSFAATSSFSLGVISKVKIVKGLLSATKLSPSGKLAAPFFEAQGFSSELDDVDLNAFGASLSKSLAPGQNIQMTRAPWWGPLVAYAASPGDQPAAHGMIHADALRFQTFQATSVKSNVRLFPKEVFFDDLGFDLYGGHAKGDVNFNFADLNPRYKLKAQLTGVDVAKFLAEIPSARGYMTGKMHGDMLLDGEVTRSPDPLAGMHGTGNLSVRNGNLPKLQLNKNLLQLAKLSNLGATKGDPGSFSSIAADLIIANNRITSREINVVGNGVSAVASGSMTLLGKGSLDYQGVASILAGSGTNQLGTLIAGMSGATVSNGKMILPFGIGGNLSVPKFILKSAGAGQMNNLLGGKLAPGANSSQKQSPSNLFQGIAGAFKKK